MLSVCKLVASKEASPLIQGWLRRNQVKIRSVALPPESRQTVRPFPLSEFDRIKKAPSYAFPYLSHFYHIAGYSSVLGAIDLPVISDIACNQIAVGNDTKKTCAAWK
jgi:hypothetical protein